jgi:TDP-4-amino-4,6-dideoxy-D-glucose deaminase
VEFPKFCALFGKIFGEFVMKSSNNMKTVDCQKQALEHFEKSIVDLTDKNIIFQVTKELFFKPYYPSSKLTKKFGLTKQKLRNVYSYIRLSNEAKELFKQSPYHYLAEVLGNLSRNSERTYRIINGKTSTILCETMELFISETCNAKCKFCYRNGANYEKEKVLSTSQYEALIDDFAKIHGRRIDISGGLEPLLSSSIIQIMQAGLRHNLEVGLYTNGIALNKQEIINQILSINKVRVSLNSHDRKSYLEIVGVDKFDCVIDNLRNLIKAKENVNSDVKVGIGFVAFNQNYMHIPEIVQLSIALGIDFLDLRSVEVTDLGDFTKEERNELRSILNAIRQESSAGKYGKLSVSIADTFNLILDSHDDSRKYINGDLVNALCHFRVTVTPQGKVYALNIIGQPSRENRQYLLGNVAKSKLSQMLRKKIQTPFEPEFLLAHDLSLVIALSKIQSDLQFGLAIEENPFNWAMSKT